MPYVLKNKYGFKILTMPPLTRTLGPWFRTYPGNKANSISEEIQLMNEIIDKLPKFDYFTQCFHYELTNWLPFYWRGFSQTTRYTYIFEDLSKPDLIWKNIRKKVKKPIQKAERNIIIRDDLGVETLLRINRKTYDRQGLKTPFPDELVRRVVNACISHDCGKMFFAEDSKGNIHATQFIVWDKNSAFGIISAADPVFRSSGAQLFVKWHAIQFARNFTNRFDFQGSMMKNVETVFRGFGAQQKRYFSISKTNSLGIRIYLNLLSYKDLIFQK